MKVLNSRKFLAVIFRSEILLIFTDFWSFSNFKGSSCAATCILSSSIEIQIILPVIKKKKNEVLWNYKLTWQKILSFLEIVCLGVHIFLNYFHAYKQRFRCSKTKKRSSQTLPKPSLSGHDRSLQWLFPKFFLTFFTFVPFQSDTQSPRMTLPYIKAYNEQVSAAAGVLQFYRYEYVYI